MENRQEELHSFVREVSGADGFMAFLGGWFLETKTAIVQACDRVLMDKSELFANLSEDERKGLTHFAF